jgi:pimeloyl-ACP methyl ester carboxylesterase
MPSYRRTLVHFGGPVTLMTGANDVKFTGLSRELWAVGGTVRHETVPGAGHNLLLEAPGAVQGVLVRALLS